MRSNPLGLALFLALVTNTVHAQYYGYPPSYEAAAQATAEVPAATGPFLEGSGVGCAEGCETCGDGACGPECWRWKPRGLFAEFEYNLWWTKTRTVPPLATTSAVGTPLIDVGVLPGATVLLGGDIADTTGEGGRLTFGKWLDAYQTTAIAARLTAFEADDGSFTAVSDGTTNLAIPFVDALSGAESSYIIGYTPDGTTVVSSGSINVEDELDLYGAEVFGNFLIFDEGGTRFDFFGGYHMLRLDNDLTIGSSLSSFGVDIATQDVFATQNEFHGGFAGVMATVARDRWFFNISGKFSVGNVNQRVTIDGATVVSVGGVTDVREEGLFALGSNQGQYTRDRVAYIPEANLKLGYRVRENMAVTVGYNFLYISSVALSGDQIDRTLNLTQTNGGVLFGPERPLLTEIRHTDFWAQGLNFGLEVAF